MQPETPATRRWSAFDAVRIILGVLLLAAAALKGYQLATEPAIATSLLTSHWFLMAVVEWELLLGVWLLAGVFPNILRWTVLVWFVLLLGTSLSQAVGGARSCACFGFFEVAPWLVALFDAAAVIALWLPAWNPKGQSHQVAYAHPARIALLFAGYLLLAIPSGWAVWNGRDAQPLLVADPAIIELGNIPQGAHAEREFWLLNRRDVPVTITAIESSCPCAHLQLRKRTVASSEKVFATVQFDSSHEPDFSGRLRLTLTGKTAREELGFSIVVVVAVERSDDSAHWLIEEGRERGKN